MPPIRDSEPWRQEMPIDFKSPEPEKKGVMICLDCGHKTEASDTDIHELLSLDVVHTPCHRAEKTNRGRMVRVTEPMSIDVPTEKEVKQ